MRDADAVKQGDGKAIVMCERKGVSLLLISVVAFTAMVAEPTPARADVGTIVPSYFFPGTGGPGGSGDGWAAMDAAAGQVHLTAILNPNSGPSSDPNVIAAYTAATTNLEAAGGKVVAYVFTNDGNTPLATVEGQISTYITQYGKLINGFFLDAMFLTPSTLSYYQTINSFIKGLSPSYTVIGNPGQPFLNGVTPQQYLSTADVFNIFEGPNTDPNPSNPQFANYPYGVNWFQSYPSNRFSNTIFDVPANAGDPLHSSAMLADLAKAYKLNAGDIYITNGMLPNPYSQLPSYWDQEVAAISSLPEPSSLTMVLVTGSLFGMARFARRCVTRRSRASR
jgi:hypothetical protein